VLRAAAAAVWAGVDAELEVDLAAAVEALDGLVEQPVERAAVDDVPERVGPGL
jgi:hypothetical protein